MKPGGHQQLLMNNSSNNIVWQFSYGGFNGAVHLLGENARMVDTSNSL